MMRTTLFHILLLMAPTILFLGYLVLARKVALGKGETAKALRALPWPWLLGTGLCLMAASLVVIALTSGDDPEGTYVPPHVVDGEVVPAEMREAQ